MEQLRIGLIGCGGMGTRLAQAVNALETARISAVCDILEDKAAAAKEKLGADEILFDYRKLLDSKSVEAVIIATPCYLHAPMALDAAAAGKHIFTEKPMALNVEDCDAMIAAARKAGVKLMVGHVLRYIGHFQRIRDFLATGQLGKVRSVEINRVGLWQTRQGWRLKASECGGMLYEVHVHELDYMACLLGEPISVYAQSGRFVNKHIDFDDDLMAIYRFADGAYGSLHASFASAIERYTGRVICEGGTIVYGESGWGSAQFAQPGAEPQILDCSGVPQHHERETREFVESVLNDTDPPIPGADGRRAISMAQGAYLSAATGEPVKLPL